MKKIPFNNKPTDKEITTIIRGLTYDKNRRFDKFTVTSQYRGTHKMTYILEIKLI